MNENHMVPPLLNFNNVPGGTISGCSGDMVNWISDVSDQRYLTELGPDFDVILRDLEDTIEDIPELTVQIEEQLNKIETESIPLSTKQQMISHVKKFRQFLCDKQLDHRFEKVPNVILNKYLRYFYSELRKNNTEFYAPSSLICIRAALHRYSDFFTFFNTSNCHTVIVQGI